MDAGKLNKKITIQNPVETRDTDGSLLKTWTDVTTLWANVKYKTVKQDSNELLDYTIVNVQFTIRKHNITPKNRIKFDSKYFKIIADYNDIPGYTTLICTVVE